MIWLHPPGLRVLSRIFLVAGAGFFGLVDRYDRRNAAPFSCVFPTEWQRTGRFRFQRGRSFRFRSVYQQLTGKNFVLDDTVKGGREDLGIFSTR
jgi:hypothetical protein